MKKILKRIENYWIAFLSHFNIIIASKYLFMRYQHKKLNLKSPKTFNEKLMYLKIYNYNQNEVVWKCCDKFYVREFAISKGICENNLPKLLDTYNDPKEIDFNKLPNKFVLKCSHGCGFNIICTNKTNIDEKNTRRKLKKWLKTKFGYETAELHYTHVKPRIICEEFIGDGNSFPWDYKVYCFFGVPKIVLVCTDRETKYETHFYDINWNKLNMRNNQSQDDIAKPQTFDEMLKICEKLAKDFPFVRIDFYEWNNRAVLGEMTFTPAACLAMYNEKGDSLLSGYLDINKLVKGDKYI